MEKVHQRLLFREDFCKLKVSALCDVVKGLMPQGQLSKVSDLGEVTTPPAGQYPLRPSGPI